MYLHLALAAVLLSCVRTFGNGGFGRSGEAANKAVNLWMVAGPDPRLPSAEVWSSLALRQHEVAAHPDCPDPEVELAAQRESAAKAR